MRSYCLIALALACSPARATDRVDASLQSPDPNSSEFDLNSLPLSRRLDADVRAGPVGAVNFADPESGMGSRCDSNLFVGALACCWKKCKYITAKRNSCRYQWLCDSTPDNTACEKATPPTDLCADGPCTDPYACKRHVDAYNEYSLKVSLRTPQDVLVLTPKELQQCGVGVQAGIAKVLNISKASIEILSEPLLTTAGNVGILRIAARFVEDPSVKDEAIISNIESAMAASDAFSNVTALDLQVAASIRRMEGTLANLTIQGVSYSVQEVRKQGSPIAVSEALPALASIWVSLALVCLQQCVGV